ncbi:MAG TPA: hypothetical protein VEM96_10830 [Pyrinomonadaceae bacterium]|nr:hypothetical protein [Pyrinomonadaceae bacterium]
MNRFLIIVLVVGTWFLPAQLSERISEKDGRDAIHRWLARMPGAQGGSIVSIDDAAVMQAFPSERFYILRYPRYPVAQVLPEALTYNNLVVTSTDRRVEQIPDTTVLETIFRSKLITVKDERRALSAVTAWLRLTQEFHQDGFLEFSKPDDTLKALRNSDGITALGTTRVIAEAGNNGQIAVVIKFDRTGKCSEVQETANVIAGRRPNF